MFFILNRLYTSLTYIYMHIFILLYLHFTINASWISEKTVHVLYVHMIFSSLAHVVITDSLSIIHAAIVFFLTNRVGKKIQCYIISRRQLWLH